MVRRKEGRKEDDLIRWCLEVELRFRLAWRVSVALEAPLVARQAHILPAFLPSPRPQQPPHSSKHPHAHTMASQSAAANAAAGAMPLRTGILAPPGLARPRITISKIDATSVAFVLDGVDLS